MKFNPEDDDNFGPHCRNCHKGGSDCDTCHSPWGTNALNYKDGPDDAAPSASYAAYTSSISDAAHFDNYYVTPGKTTYEFYAQWRKSRTVSWADYWDTTSTIVTAACSNDGFSFPHRTMGWKMLKDELWGLDRDGSVVGVGQPKTVFYQGVTTDPVVATQTTSIAAHDLDSVCLDCHNPNVWRASSYSSYSQANGPYDDQLLLRGLP